ncbi:MAG: DNA polymerase I [Thermoleophilia bacterium]
MAGPDLTGAVFLIDGNSLAYRAFYALPESIATSDGLPTNALYGFANMLVKIIIDYQPAGVVVAWDAGKRVFRHDSFEEYKAGRKPTPDNLSLQFQHFDELVGAFGIENLKLEGYEADDILATLTREARVQGQKVVIVTADRDALQLVDDGVFVMSNTKGVSEVRVYDHEAVVERYGIPPEQVPDFIGLKGDSSDNIPGVPGIGDKTAAALLGQFGSIEAIIEHADELKGKRRQLIEEYAEQALFSKELATLHEEVPLGIDASTIQPGAPDRGCLRDTLARFEFNTLIRRLEELGMLEQPEAQREALAVARATGKDLDALVGGGELALAWEAGDDTLRLAFFQESGKILLAEMDAATLAATLAPGSGGKPAPKLLAHDCKELLRAAPALPAVGFDTAIAAYLLKPAARSYELDQLAAEVGIGVTVAAGSEGESRLAETAALTGRLASFQQQQLEAQGLERLFDEVEMPLVRILAEMERTGIKLDLARLGELALKVSDQLEQLADEIIRLAGRDFNIDSPQQLSVILFEELGLPPGKKTKTGYSTDASVLKWLRDQHPIVARVEVYRELAKLSSTYLLALPALADPDSWRIHTTFNQMVTATGRLSSSSPNLQNIPVRTAMGEKIRDCFIAEEGNQLVVADYSQVELRIMAHLSREPKLLEAFRAGEDVHRATASEVFKVPLDAVTSEERNRAKAVNFGIMYGISPFGLAEQLDVPQGEAAEYITTYLQRYSRVAAFRDEIIAGANRQGFVATLFGRRRPLPELRSGNEQQRRLGERMAVNTVIQGSAADIIKVAMINCRQALDREGLSARLVLQVHDELVFEAPLAEVETVAAIAESEMRRACELDPPLVVDVGNGDTWLNAK